MGNLGFYSFHNALNINVGMYWYPQNSTQCFAEHFAEFPNFRIYFLPII